MRGLVGGIPRGVDDIALPWKIAVDMFIPVGSWDSWLRLDVGELVAELGSRDPVLSPSWLGWFRGRLALKGREEAGGPVSSGFVSALFLLLTCWSVVSSVSISWSEDGSVALEGGAGG